MKLIDLQYKVFGKLTVLKRGENRVEPSGKTKVYWLCRCECGTEKEFEGSSLRQGTSRSCGCVGKERIKNFNLSHNMSKSKEYRAWQKMKERCYNPNIERYPVYGGRGIKVCDRWLESFDNFYEDMGPRPSSKHSIDRIDVNGDYEPGNCRWVTMQEQHYNKRNTLYVEYKNENKSLSELCKIYNLNYKSTWKNYKKGFTFEGILTKNNK